MSGTDRFDAPPFSVLVVCTANQCRSPVAEHLLRAALRGAGVGWTVRSAGTHAGDGAPMHELARRVLQEAGVEPGEWRSQALDAELIEAADLILTAEAAHRAWVVTQRADALARTYPLLQFARLAQRVPAVEAPTGEAAGGRLLEGVHAARHLVQPVMGDGDDIVDPIGRRIRAFRHMAATIGAAVDAIVAPLSGPGPNDRTRTGSTLSPD